MSGIFFFQRSFHFFLFLGEKKKVKKKNHLTSFSLPLSIDNNETTSTNRKRTPMPEGISTCDFLGYLMRKANSTVR